jgi:hypothetical protein
MGVTHALRGWPSTATQGLSEAGNAQLNSLNRDVAAIKIRAMEGLQEIERAINDHPTTGGAKRSNSERHLRHGSRNGS